MFANEAQSLCQLHIWKAQLININSKIDRKDSQIIVFTSRLKHKEIVIENIYTQRPLCSISPLYERDQHLFAEEYFLFEIFMNILVLS